MVLIRHDRRRRTDTAEGRKSGIARPTRSGTCPAGAGVRSACYRPDAHCGIGTATPRPATLRQTEQTRAIRTEAQTQETGGAPQSWAAARNAHADGAPCVGSLSRLQLSIAG